MSLVERAILVLNPSSGARDPARMSAIHERLRDRFDLEAHALGDGEDAREIARAAIGDRGATLLIAAGGDGTVSRCAGAAIGTRAALAIIPCGTSNSIARALGLPSDLDAACDAIGSGRTRTIDAAIVNGHAMVLLASIGIHAETIDSTPSEEKAALGKLAYVMHAIARLASASAFDAWIETEQGATRLRAMALTIANLAPPETIWAHGAPELVPDDGLLDVTIASAETPVGAAIVALELARCAAMGSETSSHRVGYTRCTRARVVASPPQPILVDGDVIGETPMDVEVVPRGLAIRGA